MSTITLPNIRVGSDLQVRVRLKDGGVAIDWSTLQNIKACIYSDAQRALAGRCAFSIDEEDNTLLVCTYAANKPQYLGVNRIVISAKYMGETKTYDKPAFSFVRWTADQEGEEITIDDPDVDVEITVEDVSSSILQEAVDAAFSAADRANEAAEAAEHMVDIHTGPEGKSAYDVAVEEGYTGTEEEWLASLKGDTGETPDISIGTVTTVAPGTPASASMTGTPEEPVLNLSIPQGVVGATPNFTVGTVTTGEPGSSVIVTITGTPEAPVLNVTIPQGMQGNTGSSVDYPYELVNNLTTNDATKGLSAAQGVVLDGKVSQLEADLNSLPRGKNYGFFTSSSNLPADATEEGFAYVGATEPYEIWEFDGTTWTDSGVTANAFAANAGQVQDSVDNYLEEHPTITGTFNNAAKRALVSLLRKVAFIDTHGQDYIDELEGQLFMGELDHIQAVFTQGTEVIYDFYDLDRLRDFLVVTAFYTDGTTEVVTSYLLSGSLESGTSTITVTFEEATDTFSVTVTGTVKLYMDGNEYSSLTGGWQTKGFNLTNASPRKVKQDDGLLIIFDSGSTSAGAGSFSTTNQINLTGLTKVFFEVEVGQSTGRGSAYCYWPATLSESTSQSGAYGSDYSSNRNWIGDPVDMVDGETTLVERNIGTSRSSAYVSINFNPYAKNGVGFPAGTYIKIKKVCLV